MVQAQVTTPSNVVERNIRLTAAIMRYLMDYPQVLDVLPDAFELVVLPDDDPEMRLYNLDLLDRYGDADTPVVLARVRSRQDGQAPEFKPILFVPVAVS